MTVPVSMKHRLQMVLCNTEIDNGDFKFNECCKKRGNGEPCRFTDEQFSNAIDAILDAMREPSNEAIDVPWEFFAIANPWDNINNRRSFFTAVIDAIKAGK